MHTVTRVDSEYWTWQHYPHNGHRKRKKWLTNIHKSKKNSSSFKDCKDGDYGNKSLYYECRAILNATAMRHTGVTA